MSTTTLPGGEPIALTAAGVALPTRPRIGGRRTPQWWREAAIAYAWLTLLVVVALWVHNGGIADLGSLSGALTSTGRLAGLVSSHLLIVQVLLMARIPLVEASFGQDRLARRHRVVGFTSFTLMLAHLVLIGLGYAAATDLGIWGTILDLVLNYPGMLLALAGTVALVMVVVTSARAARARLRYESWHLIHLYAYLGVGLAMPHQVWTGTDFLGNRAATIFWWAYWGSAMLAVLGYRVVLPLLRSRRHRLVVADVRAESPTTTSIVVTGRDLHELPAAAGQFFQWRFLDHPGASRAHPYSLSAAPDGQSLRITAAHLGDASSGLATLRRGSRVLIEGPYGRLHAGVRTREKVALIGCGIGITPLRALLEDLPQRPGDVTVIHRARGEADLVLSHEMRALAQARGARYIPVLGRRITSRASWLPRSAAHLDDAQALTQLMPDLLEHDIYACGNPQWVGLVTAAARRAGVPAEQIHHETFSY